MHKKYNGIALIIFISLIIYLILSIINPNIPSSVNSLFKTKITDIQLDKKNIILVSDEEITVTSNVENVKWYSMDSSVATVENGVIKAQGVGMTTIEARYHNISSTLKVTVTDLITKPTINNKKEYLKCNQYSETEATMLDEILLYRIKEAGYQTRAGVVAAARFLTLEFPYRISYFYENGRLLTNDERPYVDGEGRYYHQGLFLHESKKKYLATSMHGPAIWGCPLYSRITKVKSANGLDCSAYVSWALLNGGFEVGDAGAGISAHKTNDLDDLGEKLSITKENLKTDKIKVGDLLSRNGHIGILIGKDEENYYIAESLTNDVHVLTMNEKKLLASDWQYFILLDNIYKEDGNLKNMW